MDDTDFAEGFRQGFRMIRGGNAFIPYLPPQPPIPPQSTAFREGLKLGIAKAGMKLVVSNPARRRAGGRRGTIIPIR